jgi:integrase/recombinase XerD
MRIDDLDADLIANFLVHIETTRRNAARSRNTRLAAIRSFFRFVAMNEPSHLLHCQRILAMPSKRYIRRNVSFLDRPEIDALLATPDRSTWVGRRDYMAFIMTSTEICGSGARASAVFSKLTRAV